MKKNIEKEYKILVNENKFNTLLKLYQNPKAIKQVNYYFDTIDKQLEKRKIGLRIREKENKYIFTLKIPNNNSIIEYEKELQSKYRSAFQSNDIQKLFKQYDISPELINTVTITTYRHLILLDYAELCLDYNIYEGCSDYEIEYEYLKEHDGLHIFNSILSTINETYSTNCNSKLKRALDSLKK